MLVVDDSRMQRRILKTLLQRAGYDVVEAASGAEALKKCTETTPDIVISDWMMPEMNGIEFCRAFREMNRDSYGYFILLTSKSEKSEIAQGLTSGADDFLSKPVNGDELRARLSAGDRILRMEAELREKNRLVNSTLTELRQLYANVDRDLDEAGKLQQSLVKERNRSFGNSEISLLLRPSGQVGGDLVGFFPINARRVAIFGLDVSGHGITSALMTARIAGYLSGSSPDQNIALVQTEYGIYDARDPAEIASYLNDLVLHEMQTSSYFTMIYADIDLISGVVKLVQAGHPHPVILRADGSFKALGFGGLPIGLIEDATYETITAQLFPGDRLFMVSDGVTEAADAHGNLLDEHGFLRVISESRSLRGPQMLEAIQWHVANYTDGEVADDISAVLFEFDGAKINVD
ncbi:PP2C family protein-serine/threonine phosphatase [Albirhodobacter sp. R86504]|uniref:PP2C family protein-serine/threonine phosphatase n=1 Tax=Albirhodobacter sp. R86504 TaxID=3093848 RepID=UPI00366F13D5